MLYISKLKLMIFIIFFAFSLQAADNINPDSKYEQEDYGDEETQVPEPEDQPILPINSSNPAKIAPTEKKPSPAKPASIQTVKKPDDLFKYEREEDNHDDIDTEKEISTIKPPPNQVVKKPDDPFKYEREEDNEENITDSQIIPPLPSVQEDNLNVQPIDLKKSNHKPSNNNTSNDQQPLNLKSIYLKINTGKSFTKKLNDSNSGIYENGRLKNDFTLNFGIGKYLYKNFRTDLTISQYNYNLHNDTEFNNSGQHYISRSQKIKSTALILNGYYDTNSFNNITPYLSAGFGFSLNKAGPLTANLSKEASDAQYPTVIYPAKSTTNFTWQVGLGTIFNLNSKINIDIGYKFSDFGKIKTQAGLYQDNSGLWKTSSELPPGGDSLKTHEITFGVRYNF